MLTRIITGTILIVLTGTLLWVPGLHVLFAMFIVILTTIATWEYFHIISPYRVDMLSLVSLCLVPVIVLSGSSILSPANEYRINIVFVLTFGIIALLYIFSSTANISILTHSWFALFYFGWVPAHLLTLHTSEGGPGWITFFIVAVALCDSGAYLIGKWIGKRPLAVSISPNKTWEGSVGGVVFSLVGMGVLWALAHYLPWRVFPQQSILFYLKWGIILSVLSQFGDLLESRWKREAGIKDAGHIFPGHGGVLDRCDGMLFTLPFFYYLRSIL